MATTYTGSHEPLFLPEVNPEQWFEKQASLGKVPEDDKKWPGFVLSEIHKQLPFLSDRDVAINMARVEPEAGFAFGYALIRNTRPSEVKPKDERSFIRIPIMITDRQLQPFHVFVLGGKAYPLTKERVEEAMIDPAMFAGAASLPDKQKGLMDELFPPYQQRQGFGRTSESGSGVQKLAEAEGNYAAYPAESLDPKELARLAKLRRYGAYDAAMRDLSVKDRAPVIAGNLAKSSLVGAGIAAAHGGLKAKLRGMDLAKRTGLGAAISAGSYAANVAHSTVSRKLRDRERVRAGMLAKEASDANIEMGHKEAAFSPKRINMKTVSRVIRNYPGDVTGYNLGKARAETSKHFKRIQELDNQIYTRGHILPPGEIDELRILRNIANEDYRAARKAETTADAHTHDARKLTALAAIPIGAAALAAHDNQKNIEKKASEGDIESLRKATDPQMSCATCTHFESAGSGEGYCRKFAAPCAAQMVCDEWKGDKTASVLAALWPRT